VNRDLLADPVPRTLKAPIGQQKVFDAVASRPCLTCELFYIAASDWIQPSPWSPQGNPGMARNFICVKPADQKRIGQGPDESRIGRPSKQSSAPTSLTLRELICAGAQGRSSDGCSGIQFPWGNPREAIFRRLGALHCRQDDSKGAVD
jgi:hypothetical protein